MSTNSQPNEASDEPVADLRLESVTDGQNERGIPIVKFLDDIDAFTQSFTPPASAELLIGAYSDLFAKFKSYESSLSNKKNTFVEKIPEIEKSLQIVQQLRKKQDKEETLVTRYSLADAVFGKAEVDTSSGIVNLWLGANVMLEYTYEEATELLTTKLALAKKELGEVIEDLSFTRNQIITAEVSISRVYNWDVKRKRDQVKK